MEFKVAKESNSGVFLRSGNTKNVLAALEVQVHESKDGSKYGMVGAIYDALPPAKKMQKPVGEWNHYTITCNDNKASLVFNGEMVWDIDLTTVNTDLKGITTLELGVEGSSALGTILIDDIRLFP